MRAPQIPSSCSSPDTACRSVKPFEVHRGIRVPDLHLSLVRCPRSSASNFRRIPLSVVRKTPALLQASESAMSLHKDVYEPFLSAGFKHKEVKIPPHEADPSLELQLHVLHYEPSAQPAEHTLVLLHGHPQSALIWHRVAPELVKKLRSTRIIIPDLRGHGKSQAAKVERTESGKYANEAARARYSKREMARDTIELSKQLGWQQGSDNKLWIAAHDRGAVSGQKGRKDARKALNF